MTSSATESWQLRWFDWSTLDLDTLHRLLQLRSRVFVVEQDCVFLDIDGRDPACEHLCAFGPKDELIGTLRLVPPGDTQPLPALGRVVVALEWRGRGLARALMRSGIRHCAARYPGSAIHLSAQEHLQPFYASLGFERCSERYLDDGIWHVDMRRN